MRNYSKDGITIALVLDTRKALQNGEYPIKVRVTYNRVVKYYITGKSLTPEEWTSLPSTKNRELVRIRKDIENSFELVQEAVEELAYAGEFSHERLISRLRNASVFTIEDLFSKIIKEMRNEGRIQNASIYNTTIASISRFGERRTPINSITTSWLKRYNTFLQSEEKSQTSIAIYLRTLRAVLNRAKSEGLIRPSDYPFGRGKFEIQEGDGRKMALTIEQIGRIARYDDGTELTQKYRDWWLFLYMCNGINMADFVQLRYKDIVNGEIRFVRKKTARTTRKRKEIVVVVSEPMQKIIERWGNPVAPNNYIFPILKGGETPEECVRKKQNATRAISQRMTKIGKVLGIDKISTYTARHSFATVLKRSGANIAYISESLGHTDLKTTEHYLASFEREEREKNAALLTQW